MTVCSVLLEVSVESCLVNLLIVALFPDYTHGAKRQPKSLQTSNIAKQRKYDYQHEDDTDSELEDGYGDGASSRSDELVDRPKMARRQKEKQRLEDDEDVEDYDADDTGYSSTDLYEPDDLSHLTQLGDQEEEDQAESQESDSEVDSATIARDLPVKKLKTVKCRPFDVPSKKSFQRRFESLGSKWILSTSTVVEDKLYEIGLASEFYSPIHSFMVDCDDAQVARNFTELEWNEICGEWPTTQIPAKTVDYVESFSDVESLQNLEELLKQRPKDIEEQLVYRCLEDWLHIYTDDPSPFLITERLSESYWQQEVWGVTRKLAKGFLNCKMLPGEKAGVESKERQNRIKASKGLSNTRACYGKKGDLFCRSFDEPMRDWAVVEAAKAWNIYLSKYTIESSTKLPRQLHDMLMHRTKELGSVDRLRKIAVPGLVMGGPVVQSLNLCWGRAGVNVTRFRRGLAARMESTMDKFGMSLSAVYVLMMFRADIRQFVETFHAEQKRIQRKARLQQIMLFAEVAEDAENELPGELLYSSP
ncbi:hypothetical protein BGZ82_002275 [Podila clonocystis]|nr:hypothetical protein BGZ82_002275 [Podila clonocystis]